MDNQRKPQVPLCIRRARATEELVNAVNSIADKHGIPFYILDDILFRICSEVREGVERELSAAAGSYSSLISEYEKNCSEGTKEEPKEVRADG